jgi:hypothetical protein
MMRCKGKVEMEEANSLAKVSWQWTLIKGKEIQKMEWIWMGSKKREWAYKASLRGLFDVHWTLPWRY